MKTKLSLFVSFLMLLIFATGSSDAWQKPRPASHVELLETGEFHGDQVSARTGERWLGLHVSEHGSLLLQYRLSVEAVHDGIVDEDEEQKTGKAVSVDLPLKPSFLVKGSIVLREGPVTTILEGEKALEKASPLSLSLAEHSYVLKIVGAEDKEKCSEQLLPMNAKLVLASGDSAQVLYSLQECGNDAGWILLWAGDLDRDGKLDLYVSVNQHYNVSERRLFLSSSAADGQLVKEVADFVTSGC